MDFYTRCIHGSDKRYDKTGAINVPIFQSATFAHPAVGESTGFDYSRLQNPTREYLEETVANLEGGTTALAFTTGMAAVSTMMELFSPGDHIIASDDLYGGSRRLFRHVSQKNGITFDFVNTAFLDDVTACIRPETKAIFIETPSNPMMQVTDIAATAAICKAHNLLLLVDNTFLTPYFQQPLALGADIVLHSGTKFLGGHNDTLAGFLVLKDASLVEQLRFLTKTIGAGLSPFDSFLITRGIKTLPIRMERQQQTALALASFLCTRPEIRAVHYAGLPEHPGYQTMQAQASGFGAMISFETKHAAMAPQILSRVRIMQYAESLGGTETLITYPMLQTHADVPQHEREAKGIDEHLLRLSVGLESPQDLMADLTQALEGDALHA